MSSHQPHTTTGATGTQYHLYGHGYSAVVVSQGGGLRSLEFEGRPLIVSYGADEPMPAYRGALVAPWPNRIADATYVFDGVRYSLEVNEPGRNTALHGLASFAEFECVSHSSSAVTLRRYLAEPKGYPFDVYVTVTYELRADGLHTTVVARNVGVVAAPYGVCPHPYLVAGPGPLDTWVFGLPAARVLLTDDRLLPRELVSVFDDASFDFQPDANGATREIGTKFLDHAFTGLNFDANGQVSATLWDPTHECGSEITWDAACPWVQVHTADTNEPETSRVGLAIEPMTCAPNAFNSGEGLVSIAPNSEHVAWWRVGIVREHP